MAKKTKKSGDKGSTVVLKKTKAHSEVLGKHMSSPPLLNGENSADYEAFRSSCLHAVGPKDAIEEIWLQDVIDYSWEAQRLRRMKAPLIEAARRQVVEILIKDHIDDGDFNDPGAARYYLEKTSMPVSGLKKCLPGHLFKAPFETDIERDMAILQLASKKLSKLIRYERRAANRRDKALRELEQARSDL